MGICRNMDTRKKKLCCVSTICGLCVSARKHLHCDDGHGEDSLLQTAGQTQVGEVGESLSVAKAKSILAITHGLGVGRARAQRGVHVASTFLRAVTRQDRNGDHGSNEADVQHHGDEAEEHDAAEADREQRTQQSIEGGRARHALDGSHPFGNGEMVVCQHSQEVGVDA